MPKVIWVIQSEEHEGNGTTQNPDRKVYKYYTLEGDLLAVCDPWEIMPKDEDDQK